MRDLLQTLAIAALAYFAAVNGVYLLFTAVAWLTITHHRRERAYSAVDEAFASPLTPPISVLLPAYNEEAGIVESVRSLLALHYPQHEVVVVNDGSTDDTMAKLCAAFDLVPIRKALRETLPTRAVRGAYTSPRHPELWVLDKENGGKGDALNCGVNAAAYPYVCAIDADAMLEEDALLRVAKPVLDDPELVAATGGIVRIANGCTIDHGRVVAVGVPRSALGAMQVALEEFSFRRHVRNRDVAKLLAFAVLENFGYRQLNDWWRLRGLVDVARRRREWGEMKRRGLGCSSGAARSPSFE
jgi:cellulose synthase/poly-beta-1,6-N-acetylglucosamine synthase-like glycosyltransferase